MLRDAPKAETQSSGDIKIQPSPVLSSRYTLTFRNITTQKNFLFICYILSGGWNRLITLGLQRGMNWHRSLVRDK